MKYILDTDILIYFLKGYEQVVSHFINTPPEKISTTIINHTELLFGGHHSQRKKQNLTKVQPFLEKIDVLPFCKEASAIFAEQKSSLKNSGKLIDDMDLMIASIALKHQYVLVTNNTKHFERIKKLKIENWYLQ